MPLSRLIFAAPTRFYKTGIVFLAWLNGHQDHFTMVGGQESARSVLHLSEIFRLADRAGLFSDPALAADAHAQASRGPRGGVTMRDLSADAELRHLSLNTATVRKQGDLAEIVEAAKRHGISCLSPWRDQIQRVWPGAGRARSCATAASGCPAIAAAACSRPIRAHRAEMRDDNRRAVDEAAALGAPCLVLVVGGLPQFSRPGSAPSIDIAGARAQVEEALAELLTMRRRPECRSPSSRCIRCMRPTAPA